MPENRGPKEDYETLTEIKITLEEKNKQQKETRILNVNWDKKVTNK